MLEVVEPVLLHFDCATEIQEARGQDRCLMLLLGEVVFGSADAGLGLLFFGVESVHCYRTLFDPEQPVVLDEPGHSLELLPEELGVATGSENWDLRHCQRRQRFC